MSQGHEYVQQVQRALSEFEDAVVRREHKKLLESSVSVQQDVDKARRKVVDAVVQIVTKVRLDQ
jgi:hypothetical protein